MIKLCAFADEASNDLQGQIEALKSNNIELLELRSIDGKNVLDFTNEDCAKYKKMLDENGIKVWSIGSPIGKVEIDSNFDEYLEKYERILDVAEFFDAKNIRGFSFYNAYGKGEEVIKRVTVFYQMAKDKDIDFCHENEKDIYGDTLERVLEIKDNVSGLKLIYDPANYLQCKQNATECLDKTIDRTKYFHIKDVDVKTDEVVPAGYGDGDIIGLVNKVKNREEVVFTLEPHLRVFPGYSSIDNTEMKNKFVFKNNTDSFNCAVKSIKEILVKCGLKEVKGGFVL